MQFKNLTDIILETINKNKIELEDINMPAIVSQSYWYGNPMVSMNEALEITDNNIFMWGISTWGIENIIGE